MTRKIREGATRGGGVENGRARALTRTGSARAMPEGIIGKAKPAPIVLLSKEGWTSIIWESQHSPETDALGDRKNGK